MADGVSVDLDALTTFAQQTSGTADGHVQSSIHDGANFTALSIAMKGLTGAPAEDPPTNMCVVRNGFLEAQDFAVRHTVMAEAALQLIEESVNGLACLSSAAETCAITYADTDAANAAMMKHINTADGLYAKLTPGLDGTGTVSAADVRDAFAPTTKDETLPLLGAPSTGAPEGEQVTSTPVPDDTQFQTEVEDKTDTYRSGGGIDDAPDPTKPQTIGSGEYTLTVPADQGQMPNVLTPPAVPAPSS